MPRPTTKEELLDAARGQYEKMKRLIGSMPFGKQTAEFSPGMAEKGKEAHWGRDKNLRDVLVHLHEWHELLLDWAAPNREGAGKPFLPEPYNWKTYGDMNVKFWEKHQETPYDDAVRMLDESHQKVLELIGNFSNEELFTKKYFAWTGTSSLGSYCVSVTSSHYDWAIKKIKIHASD